MRVGRVAILASAIAGSMALGSAAEAQVYYPPCSPFPLAWPFCAAGAIVGTAANIATAPVWLSAGAPPPFNPAPYYAPPPAYYAPPPPPPPYYYAPR
jgi:hypothetical protein